MGTLYPLTPTHFLKKVGKNQRQEMAKDIRKTIRFSESEFAMIQQKLESANITFSDFARSTLLKKKIKLPIERELIYELNKIGNNLNQIAKRVNSDDRKSVLVELVEIERALKDLK
jgi:hypothetical protein